MPALYVHVPFCEKKCIYCDFYSVETFERYAEFTGACALEIRSRGAVAADVRFDSIFFGGGTPSLLEAEQMGLLLDALRSSYRIASDAECTVECNPGTVNLRKLEGYRALGVNRLSFGVQSFHEEDLRFLSRIHSAEDARGAVRMARAAGFDNVNADLMFSLPGQTREKWMRNLEEARALGTTHLSCYSLTVEKGTPLAVMVDDGTVRMPPEDSDAELYEITMETLERWGFHHYEVSNFSLPGRECRHNLAYWRHEDYLGFGPSAHSTWNRVRSWNVSSVRSYVDRAARGETPAAGSENLTPDLLREEYVYLRFRSEGIPLDEFRERFGSDFIADNRARVETALSAGLLVHENGTLRLTRNGYLVADEFCASLR